MSDPVSPPPRARFTVRLTPRGGRDAIDGWAGDVLRVRVSAPPEGGRANEAMIRLLARWLRVAPSRIAIVSGIHARTKMLEIEGVAPSAIVSAVQERPNAG